MNKTQLEYAVMLKKIGNYSKAAKQLGISQPALSLQIKNLETELGIYLFDRTQKPIGVTYEGYQFLDKAEQIITQFKQLESFAQGLKEDYAGEISIGIIPTLSPYLVPLFIGDINSKYPLLKVTIKELLTEHLLEAIKNNSIHLGIVATPIETTSKFEIEPLFYESFQIFISDDHPLSKQETIKIEHIDVNDLWLLKEGNCFRDQVNNLCGIPRSDLKDTTFTYESNSIEALCRIVEHQGGITFIPELSTMHLSDEKLDMLKTIDGMRKVREISLINIPNQTKIRFIKKIKETIQNNIPRKMLTKEGADIIDI